MTDLPSRPDIPAIPDDLAEAARQRRNGWVSTLRIGERRRLAYSALGISPNDVLAAPKITPLIRDLVRPANKVEGWRTALAALRASDIAEARQFLKFYDDPRCGKVLRDSLPIEAFALYAGMSPLTLWETIVRALTRINAQRGAALAAMAHPAIVEASIEQALKPEGVADREWQLKHAGFLPMPKGNVINVQASAQSTSTAQSASLTAAPQPEATIRRLTDRFNDLRADDTRALPAASVPELMADTTADSAAPTVLDAMRASQRMGEEVYADSDAEED